VRPEASSRQSRRLARCAARYKPFPFSAASPQAAGSRMTGWLADPWSVTAIRTPWRPPADLDHDKPAGLARSGVQQRVGEQLRQNHDRVVPKG
jgi:hypothetical protein